MANKFICPLYYGRALSTIIIARLCLLQLKALVSHYSSINVTCNLCSIE